jgi:hypothetical protein
MEMFLGVLVVAAAGLCMGSCVWPMKLMHKFQFEHWWFLAMLTGLVIVPWTITLAAFPNVFAAYRDVPISVLITSNLFAVSWGIANVLFGLCVVRIGVALSGAILTGLGASVAVTVPLIFKGSGLFQGAPGVTSPAGLTVLAGVGVMLIGVILASLAGFGRDRELKKLQQASGKFLVGLIMTIVAGVTSAGIMLAFVYGQGPIVARVSVLQSGKPVKITVIDYPKLTNDYTISPAGTITLPDIGPIEVRGMTAKAAADKIAGILHLSRQPEADARVRVETQDILAVFAVWAIGLLGGTAVNLGYPLYLMAKNRSWGVLFASGKEFALAVIIGVQFFVAIALAGKGMLLLGALGASVGAGIQQAMQMAGGQGLGFLSGEWRGVYGKPRCQMYLAIIALIIATIVMAYGNTLAS